MENKRIGLSNNALKIIAAIAMFIDHMGLMFFPNITIFRIIGRLAFPIFAYMIAEGCAHTKNKLKYLLTIFILGITCQIVYYFFASSTYLGILITFSFSILIIYSLQYLKETVFDINSNTFKRYSAALFFVFLLAFTYFIDIHFNMDYGFVGCLIPVLASIFRKTSSNIFKEYDNKYIHISMLAIGLVILSLSTAPIQFYSLIAVLVLLFYNGKKGKYKMKYFFYLFYPIHLVFLEIIYILTTNYF